MPRQYLLPCHCGRKLTVDSNQSGLLLRCSCGAELAVPALSGLRQLQPAAPDVERSAVPWGTSHRAALFGALLALLGWAGCAWLVWWPPEMPTVDFVPVSGAERVADYTFRDTIDYWIFLQSGIVRPASDKELMAWQRRVKIQEQLAWLAGIAGAIGVVLLVAAPLRLLDRDRPSPADGPAAPTSEPTHVPNTTVSDQR